MSLWWGGGAVACDVCGHVETGRSLETMFGRPVWYGDFVCTWAFGEVACHWCAARLDAVRAARIVRAERSMDRMRTAGVRPVSP